MTVTRLLETVPDLLTGLGAAIDARVDVITLDPNLKKYPHIDDEDLATYIDDYCGDMELSYSTIERAEKAVQTWLRAHVPNWARLAITMSLSYDPISNYDRRETREVSRSASENGESSTTTSNSGTTTDSGNGSNTTTEAVSAFDATAFENRSRTTTSAETSNSSSTETEVTSSGESSRESTGSESETIRAYGNIGVTTSQQMLESERAISTFNLYQRIAEDFKCRFCILVY